MPRAFVQTDPKLWTPDRTTRVSRNITDRLAATQQNEPHLAHMGRQFYEHWNEDAHYLAGRAGVSPAHAAAGMARLSPKTGADINRMMAYQAVHLEDHQIAHIERAREISMESRKFKDGDPKKEKLKAAVLSARAKAGLPGTPLNLQGNDAILKSAALFRGKGDDPLGSLGKVKIHDFGRAIHDPSWPGQVMDTHYHDAAIGRTDVPYETDRKLGNIGVYQAYQHAAGRAYISADRRGLIDKRSTTPNAFMGQVWYGHIQHKLDTNPDANKARRADMTRSANFLSRDNAHLWNPQAHGMRPIVPDAFRV